MGQMLGAKTKIFVYGKIGESAEAVIELQGITSLSLSGGDVGDIDTTSFNTSGGKSFRAPSTFDGGSVSISVIDGIYDETATTPQGGKTVKYWTEHATGSNTYPPATSYKSLSNFYRAWRSSAERAEIQFVLYDSADSAKRYTLKAFPQSIESTAELDGLVNLSITLKMCGDGTASNFPS